MNFNVMKRIVMDKRQDLYYDRPNKYKPIQKLMHNNENIINLTSHEKKLNLI